MPAHFHRHKPVGRRLYYQPFGVAVALGVVGDAKKAGRPPCKPSPKVAKVAYWRKRHHKAGPKAVYV